TVLHFTILYSPQENRENMQCRQDVVQWCSWGFMLLGLGFLVRQKKTETPYGRYVDPSEGRRMVPARVAWFAQELPSFLVPVLLLATAEESSSMGRALLLCTFCLHYFQRTFIYALLIHGRPCPLCIMISAIVFCSCNGFFQGYYLLRCADSTISLPSFLGLIVFYAGMAINIHSDQILRKLRKPGETDYRIPRGGLFEYISGANFFGEIVEWFGYAIATWSMPAFSFALFTMCSIGPRAYHHHRFYQKNFKGYPKSRKAVVPFIF
uniref:3-oxo-5-alpha-steroid 4-dehydrogenase n=1 Tax=Scleropages formosus TaxID=113540 RepID=A0A8C9TSW2_SCLFO